LRKKAISQWAQQMLQQDGWVMLDTETTGLERDDEVIELAVIGKDGTVLLDTLVRPQGRTDRSRFVRRSVMADRLKKEDFVRLLATRMNADEAAATAWVDGVVETLYESFKEGKGVTLPGFGGFYVRQEPESWAFKFNPGQRLRALFGWSSTYSGKL
jgi:nucleoid DNA-binding protein